METLISFRFQENGITKYLFICTMKEFKCVEIIKIL